MLKILVIIVGLFSACCGETNITGVFKSSGDNAITVKCEDYTEKVILNNLTKEDLFVLSQLAFSDNNLLIYIFNEYFFNYKGEIVASNIYDLKTKKYTFKGGVKDGKIYSLKEDGSFKTVYMYKNNKKHGLTVSYGDKNNIIAEKYYVEDLLDGVSKEYSEEGKLETEKTYKKGVLEKEREY